jgi:hypothetical protein
MKQKIKMADLLFDLTGAAILLFHIFLSFYGVYYEIFSPLTLAIIFCFTRTTISSIGHYHCHRAKNGISDWGDALFDF